LSQKHIQIKSIAGAGATASSLTTFALFMSVLIVFNPNCVCLNVIPPLLVLMIIVEIICVIMAFIMIVIVLVVLIEFILMEYDYVLMVQYCSYTIFHTKIVLTTIEQYVLDTKAGKQWSEAATVI
jgi:hypothetical protein